MNIWEHNGAQRTNARLSSGDLGVGILGAGLAGLSASSTLRAEGIDHLILEREESPGGLARSFEVDRFRFDCSGHLLHLRDSALRAAVLSSSHEGAWTEVYRKSAILLRDHLIRYPFQGNLVDAPEEIRRECLEALPPESSSQLTPETLGEWIDVNLGEGVAHWFMRPYNEKLFGVSVDELIPSALGRFLPQVDRKAVIDGAKRGSPPDGYNVRFLYPKRGGISLLPSYFMKEAIPIHLGKSVADIDLDARTVRTADGAGYRFPAGMISSIPLPAVMKMAGVGSEDLLRARSVTCVNIGFPERATLLGDSHWVYLPEDHFHAYRIGLYSNITQSASPEGYASAYIEISHWDDLSDEEALRQATRDAIALGLVNDGREIVTKHIFRIPHAYVVMDSEYGRVRSSALATLQDAGVQPVGRYGLWEYGSMEDAIEQGRSAGGIWGSNG